MPTPAKKRTGTAAADSRESRESRLKLGRERRGRLSRSTLGELKKRGPNFDPIKLLLASIEGRLPKLLPVKYSRMNASPFAFFRGAVSIMAADLARHAHSGLLVQLCGDAHVQNLGSFEGPDSRLLFDINDFDETTPGPWEWDVKRMAASIVLAGLESGHNRQRCSASVDAFANAYCETLEQLADQPILTAARFLIRRMNKAAAISGALQQAERANPCDLLKKYAETSRGGFRFKQIPGQIWRVPPADRRAVLESLTLYRASLSPERLHWFEFFRPLDVAFKIVGTGSVGLRDYVVLMQGNGSTDPLFLQIKQEVASAYAPYLKQPSYASNGQRVVDGQRRIQPLTDLLLGWTRIGEHDYLVRHLNDHKGSIDLDSLRGEGLKSLAVVAGELLARGHARSGDALAIKGYIGSCSKVLKAISRFAFDYAEITESDFDAFQKAIKQEHVKIAA